MARRPAAHKIIQSRKVPRPIGAYSHAIHVEQPGEMLFVSAQIPLEANGKPFTGDIRRQTEIVLNHLRSIVIDAKFSMDEVVKCTIFVTDMKNFDKINQVYQKMFVGQNLPARAVVEVSALPLGVGVQIEAMAVKKEEKAEDVFEDEDFF